MKTTKLNKTEKIIRWASAKKTRKMSHLLRELNMESEKQVMKKLRLLSRNGLINFTKIGQKIELHLTQTVYYNRALLVK